MNAQPTSGPWHAKILANGAFEIWSTRSEGASAYQVVICSRNQIDHACSESASNARLISAAPDMLLVCRLVQHLRQVGGVMPGVRELIDHVVDEADSAIAKVTGAAT